MAYLDFSDVMPGAATTAGLMPSSVDPLSPLEWTVVQLARRDAIGSLTATPRFARMRALLFGTRPDPQLADPRLEALRRVAVHAWHHGLAVPAREVDRFRAAGFGQRQLEMVVRWIDARRGCRGAAGVRPAPQRSSIGAETMTRRPGWLSSSSSVPDN